MLYRRSLLVIHFKYSDHPKLPNCSFTPSFTRFLTASANHCCCLPRVSSGPIFLGQDAPLWSRQASWLFSLPAGSQVIPLHYLLALSAKWAGILGMCPNSLVNLTPMTESQGPLWRQLSEFTTSHLVTPPSGTRTIHWLVSFRLCLPALQSQPHHHYWASSNDPEASVSLISQSFLKQRRGCPLRQKREVREKKLVETPKKTNYDVSAFTSWGLWPLEPKLNVPYVPRG